MTTGAGITNYLLKIVADRPNPVRTGNDILDLGAGFLQNIPRALEQNKYAAGYFLHALNEQNQNLPWVTKPTIGVEISPIDQITKNSGFAQVGHTRLWLVLPNGDGTYETSAIEADPTEFPTKLNPLALDSHEYGKNFFAPVDNLTRPLSDSHFVVLQEFSDQPDLAIKVFHLSVIAAAHYNGLNKIYKPNQAGEKVGNCHSALATVLKSVGEVLALDNFKNASTHLTKTLLTLPRIDDVKYADQAVLEKAIQQAIQKGGLATNKEKLQTALYDDVSGLYNTSHAFPRKSNDFNAVNSARTNNAALIPAAAYAGIIATCNESGAADIAQQFVTISKQAGLNAVIGSLAEATTNAGNTATTILDNIFKNFGR
jgi:hypothetical protein